MIKHVVIQGHPTVIELFLSHLRNKLLRNRKSPIFSVGNNNENSLAISKHSLWVGIGKDSAGRK